MKSSYSPSGGFRALTGHFYAKQAALSKYTTKYENKHPLVSTAVGDCDMQNNGLVVLNDPSEYCARACDAVGTCVAFWAYATGRCCMKSSYSPSGGFRALTGQNAGHFYAKQAPAHLP